MARKGEVDQEPRAVREEPSNRGLVKRKNSKGRTVWYVRLFDKGKIRWMGSFPTKK